MSATYYMKVGDRLPLLRSQLLDGDGNPINLAAATVQFRMRLQGGSGLKVNQPATVVDAANGIVQYSWAAIDTNTAGTYEGEFAVTIGGLPMTVPANSHVIVIISAVLS